MSFLLALALVTLCGLALLELLRLRTGGAAIDAALGWLVGGAVFSATAAVARLALGIPFGPPLALGLLLAPPVAVVLLRRGRWAEAGPPPAATGTAPPRWRPRPAWLFLPLAAYVAVVFLAVIHLGAAIPTDTDDGVRVRAFAPMLAFADAWPEEASRLFVMAGPRPTFLPAVGWVLTGEVDHFHVNYVVLADLVAVLALVIGVPARRGDPERGWAGAFALASLPFLAWHLTTTYADAVLALQLGAAVLFLGEHGRTRDGRDAALALLLCAGAALVKREGEILSGPLAAIVLLDLALQRWRTGRATLLRHAALLAPVALSLVARVGRVGFAGAVPLLALAAGRAGGGDATELGAPFDEAWAGWVDSLFRSGHAGMLFYLLPAALLVGWRRLWRPWNRWPLLVGLAFLAMHAVSSLFMVPRFTLDQSTVHRALIPVAVPLAIWLGGFLRELAAAPAPPADETGPPPAAASPRAPAPTGW